MFGKREKEKEIRGESTVKVKKAKKTMSKKKKRIIIAAIIVFIIALVVVLPKVLAGEPPALAVTTGSVEKMDIEQAVSIKGTIQGSQKADVATSLNYEIVSILVEEGDVVTKDQVLATLDSDDLQDDYHKSLSALSESKFNFEAAKNLYSEGAISKEEYIKAESQYESDRITVDAYDISDKVNIKSPIAGTVTRVNVNIGRYANDTEDSEPMFVVEDLQHLKMDVKISEYDISKIKVGQNVTITAEVLGEDSVTGTISRISPTGEQKDETSKEMVIPVQIDVSNENASLIAGVTAKAKIEIEKKADVLAIPIDAIMEDPDTGENFAMVLKGTKLKKIPIELGIEGDFEVEVRSGDLSEGDQVVLNPTYDMTDGMEVTPAPEL